jgi:DNA-directed RNA polymerase subunit RPC12/RpoP
MAKSGEKPGSGEYTCSSCGETVHIESEEQLPPCPSCGGSEFS